MGLSQSKRTVRYIHRVHRDRHFSSKISNLDLLWIRNYHYSRKFVVSFYLYLSHCRRANPNGENVAMLRLIGLLCLFISLGKFV